MLPLPIALRQVIGRRALHWPTPVRAFQHLALAALLGAGGASSAHDTWFAPLPGASAAQPLLALGTGDQFPKQEFAVGAEYLARQGCRGFQDSRTRPLQVLRTEPTALVVRPAQPGAATCWAQLKPFEIELPPDKVAIYLDEIHAPAAVRSRWVELAALGLPWQERYVKHARIVLTGGASAVSSPPAFDMDLDAQLDTSSGPLRVGQPMNFQVLSAGQALAGLAVELRNERSRVGLWQQTDAEGRVSLPAPLPGRWVLRGTELKASPTQAGRWDSRFLTLAFDVLPRATEP